MKNLITILFIISCFIMPLLSQVNSNDHYFNINSSSQSEDILSVIDDISSDSISAYIETLQQFTTRFELLENRFAISEWIYNKFLSFGYTDLKYDEFLADVIYNNGKISIDSTYPFRNIVCTIPGYGAPDEKFILCAHYDSFSANTNPFLIAPGADDNASGIAALLEIARVLKLNSKQPKRTICLAALAGEELMYYSYSGSKYYAEYLHSQNENIKLVINHDMIGYTDKSLVQSFVNINRNNNSEHFANLAIIAVNNYTTISAQHAIYWGADLKPFFEKGYYGIYFEETVFSPYYHSDQDILNNMNIPYCTEVIKGSCASTIWATSMPNLIEGIYTTLVSGLSNSVEFTWNKNTDFDFDTYIFYYSNNDGVSFSGALTTDTVIVVNNIANFNSVKYAIAARSTDGYESFAEIFDLSITSVESDDKSFPDNFYLKQNYPNPFNPSTIIEYHLPENVFVKVTLYDVLGNKVSEIDNGYKLKGNHKVTFNNGVLSTGIYFYHISAGHYSDSKKMLLVK